MTRILAVASACVVLTFVGSIDANAAGGCGIGWHRGPLGGCQPNRPAVIVAPRVMVAPPVVVVPRLCPPGTHVGPRGRACVRNRW